MNAPKADSWGDMVSNKSRRLKKKDFAPKECFNCHQRWIPRSGMAAKVRDYCYSPFCELEADDRRVARIRLKKKQTSK
jgi:hypothetical protein